MISTEAGQSALNVRNSASQIFFPFPLIPSYLKNITGIIDHCVFAISSFKILTRLVPDLFRAWISPGTAASILPPQPGKINELSDPRTITCRNLNIHRFTMDMYILALAIASLRGLSKCDRDYPDVHYSLV